MKYHHCLSYFLLVVTLCLSCKGVESSNSSIDKETKVSESKSIQNNTYEAKYTANNYTFLVYSKNDNASNVKLQSDGLEYEFDEELKIDGKVMSSSMADLNQDGFAEFYLIIERPSSNLNQIYGFGSNKDKSISQIAVKPLDIIGTVSQDKIIFHNNQVIREIEIDGKWNTYNYSMVPREASFQIIPELVKND